MELYKKYASQFEKFGVITDLDKAMFMAQIQHESGLKPISENLNYSIKGLLSTFPKYFNKNTAIEYARKPEKIANRVYANRMGNGDETSGEGWKYRGRGFIQLTGKENYFRLSNDTDIDFLHNPDLLLQEANAIIAALWFWKTRNLSSLANNVEAVTKKINGGLNGFNDRKELFENWKEKIV